MSRIPLAAAALALLASPALAAPSVAVDIPPVHSIVARVMEGVGEPVLILPPGASAHGHAMRPSEARALAGADLMIWVGPELTPWLDEAAQDLAPEAERVALLHAPGTIARGAHGEEDPHAWLDPLNAAIWMEAVADALSAADPANAETYGANAAQGRAEMEALAERISGTLGAPRFAVAHDAYGHFEDRFGVASLAAIADGSDAPPGAARVRAAKRDMAGAACILVEPGEGGSLAGMLAEETGARIVEADPLGGALPLGPGLYPALIEGLAEAMASCG